MRARALISMVAAVAPLAVAASSPDQPLEWIDQQLPGVCHLDPAPGGFVATLCGMYAPPAPAPPRKGGRGDAGGEEASEEAAGPVLLAPLPPGADEGDAVPPEEPPEAELMFPRVQFDHRAGWRWLAPSRPRGLEERPAGRGVSIKCPEALRKGFPRLTLDELHRLRPKTRAHAYDVPGQGEEHLLGAAGCVEHGGFVWFGIYFYDAEGNTGVGGVGRLDSRTGKIEIRRPSLLLGSSSAALAHDGRWLWLDTWRSGEGYSEPTHGLVRYDWARGKLVQEIDGPCGFRMRGAVVIEGALWVAHDAGLSRRDTRRRWQHFIFQVGKEPAATATDCAGVYEFARSRLPADHRPPFDEEIRTWRTWIRGRGAG